MSMGTDGKLAPQARKATLERRYSIEWSLQARKTRLHGRTGAASEKSNAGATIFNRMVAASEKNAVAWENRRCKREKHRCSDDIQSNGRRKREKRGCIGELQPICFKRHS